MCLISKRYSAKIALKDIECYKIVTVSWNDDYFTPCTHTKVPVKVVFGEKEFVANGFITRTKLKATNNKGKTEVEGGVIHTFSKLNEAKKQIKDLIMFDGKGHRLFECIIPRGTRYFVGEYSDYASKRIRFIEEIKLD